MRIVHIYFTERMMPRMYHLLFHVAENRDALIVIPGLNLMIDKWTEGTCIVLDLPPDGGANGE